MTVGARGAILALADFLPELCVALYDAIVAGDALEIPGNSAPPDSADAADRWRHGNFRREVRHGSARVLRRDRFAGPLLPLSEAHKKEVETLMAALAPVGNSHGLNPNGFQIIQYMA